MKTILVDAAYTFTTQENEIDQKMYKLLEEYPNRKIILTNATEKQMPKYGLVNLPYEMYTLSHEPDKVDPEYFIKFFKEYNLSADEVIYFEHTPEAVEAAESLGITAYHFDHEKRDMDALKMFLDKNLGAEIYLEKMKKLCVCEHTRGMHNGLRQYEDGESIPVDGIDGTCRADGCECTKYQEKK